MEGANDGRPRTMKALSPVLQAALLAGLFEGGLVASHTLLAGEGAPVGVVGAVLEAARVAGLHLAMWLVLGLLLLRVKADPVFLFRAAVTGAALVAFLARRIDEARFGPGAHVLLLLLLPALWLVPRARWQRLRPAYRASLGAAAVLLVSLYSLWGRAPDFRYDLGTLGELYLGSAAVAIGLTLAVVRWPRVAGAALVAVVAASLLFVRFGAAHPEDRPSVLFVLIDTTRRDHVGPFGGLVQTPDVVRLAARGVLFSDAVTVIPKTPQSVASFLTARYPIHHGVRTLYDSLSPSQPSVARAFQEAGYATTALVHNPWLSADRGFSLGFDRFYDSVAIRRDFGGGIRFVSWRVVYDHFVARRFEWRPPQRHGHAKVRDVDVTNAAIEVLGAQRGPFFMYVHYFQPHWPYQPPPRLQRRYDAPPPETSVVNNIEDSPFTRTQMIFENTLPESENEGARRLYRGEIDDTMAQVGRLLAALERSPFGDDTIVVFTADHGHALGDHAYYFHHGAFLYDSSTRIPLILSWPGHLPQGLVVDELVRSIDVAPTLLDLAGLGPGAPVDGESLREYWNGGTSPPRAALLESDVRMMEPIGRREIEGVPGKIRGWRSGRYKLIATPRVGGPRFELFDLVDDPEESRDLSEDDRHKETLESLKEHLLAALPAGERAAVLGLEGPAGDAKEAEPGVSDGDLELLRELGYVE